MPTPDGREWLTSAQMAEKAVEHLERDGALPVPAALRDRIRDAIRRGFVSTNYTQEFKILRLVEILKDAVGRGEFGPLDPGTPLAEVHQAFQNIFTQSFLDQFDEEGNLIDPGA